MVGVLPSRSISRLASGGGAGVDAVMQVDCGINLAPRGHPEGVRLSVEGHQNFNEELSGFTVFIEMP